LIQPDIPNDNPSNNETRTKKSHNHDRPDASPLLAEKYFSWRTLLVQDEQQASTRHGRAQMFLELIVAIESGRYDNETFMRDP
jgi:hypothetical protein